MQEIAPRRSASRRASRSPERPKRRVHLGVGIERPHRLVGEHEVMRRHLGGRRDLALEGDVERDDRLAGRQVHEVDGTALRRGEREVALDHDALGERRIRPDAELGRHLPLVRVPSARELGVLAVQGEAERCERAVLQRATHEPRRDDGPSVVGETDCACLGELDHLGQLLPMLSLADRREEARRDDRLFPRTVDERTQHGAGVDHGIGVRHREDRAVAAGGCRRGARGDGLLVLAPWRTEMDVRVDEGRRDDDATRRSRLDRADDAVRDRDAERLVDSLRGSEHAPFEREAVAPSVGTGEDHATPTAARASTGATVSTS